MKLTAMFGGAVCAALAVSAASVSGQVVSIDFENSWPYGDSVGTFYQASQGVVFSDSCLGLSNNDGLGSNPDGSYFANAPSPIGAMSPYAFAGVERATMTISAGVSGPLHFWYSSPEAIPGAVLAYSGPDGTGTLLGSIDLPANSTFTTNGFNYNVWSEISFSFSGTAQSFDFTGSGNLVGFDNISAIPGPGVVSVVAVAVPMLGLRRRRPAAC